MRRWWERGLAPPRQETVRPLLTKLDTELLYDTASPLLGIHPKEMK